MRRRKKEVKRNEPKKKSWIALILSLIGAKFIIDRFNLSDK